MGPQVAEPEVAATADDDVQVLLPSPKNDRRIYAGGQFKGFPATGGCTWRR